MVCKGTLWLLGITILASSIQSAPKRHCPDNWVNHGSSCYIFINGAREDWFQSEEFCRRINGKLVEIETADENQFLRQYLIDMPTIDIKESEKIYWIGASDLENEGQWVWWSDKRPMNYTDWSPNEPNDSYHHEDCACLFHYNNQNLANAQQFHWNDNLCEVKSPFICETGKLNSASQDNKIYQEEAERNPFGYRSFVEISVLVCECYKYGI